MIRDGMFRKWIDAGVDWLIEMSTDGPLIIGGQTTQLPVIAGGQYGLPKDWIPIASVGNNIGQVNFTTDTALNRFSISNALASVLTGARWGGAVMVPILPNHTYRIGFQCQTMASRTYSARLIECYQYDAASNLIPGYFAPSMTGNSAASWEDISMQTNVAAANAAFMRLEFSAAAQSGMDANWGLQYSNIFIVDGIPDSEIPPIVWRDITCDVRAFGTRYGRERFTNRYEVATCQMELNNDDGEYTYRDPHPFNLRPGRLLRAHATHGSKTVAQFYGVIDSLTDGYSLDGHAITQVVAYDPQSLFSGLTTPGSSFTPGAPLSGTRIARCLDIIGYRPRKIDAGQWKMQTIAPSGRSLRDEMGVTADSEGGSIFADRDGNIVYKDRTWTTIDPNLTQVTADLVAGEHDDVLPIVDQIPNQPGSPIVCPFELQTNWGLDRLINALTLANAGGSAHYYNDADSQTQYGIASYQRLDFVQFRTDADSKGYLDIRAKDLMDGYAVPVQRVNSVTIRPSLFPGGWDWVLALFLNWTVRVWYLNSRNEWGFAVVTHVQAIEHRITLDDWTVRLALDRPISFVTFQFSDVGWDLGVWDQDVWDG